jgi:hypothetical protein
VPVLSVTESQTVDAAGQLTDVYEVTFTVADRPGSFTVEVPKQGDPVAAAQEAIAAVEAQVAGIYGIG